MKRENGYRSSELPFGKRVLHLILSYSISSFKKKQRIHKFTKAKVEYKRNTDLFTQMIEVLESKRLYLDDKLTQEDVVRYLGTNRRYVYMAIKAHGATFRGILNERRIRTAKSLIMKKVIRGEKFLLSDIYVHCGFSTNESFYRIFRNITGTSPGNYAEQIKYKFDD